MNDTTNWIDVYVRSNDDFLARERWPSVLCCRPLTGECIEADSKKLGKVCRVTHRRKSDGSPYLEIEVTKLV
jgi:hypothetical protein